MLEHSKQNHFRSSLHHGSTEHIEGKVDVRLSSKFQPLTFASPLSSPSHPEPGCKTIDKKQSEEGSASCLSSAGIPPCSIMFSSSLVYFLIVRLPVVGGSCQVCCLPSSAAGDLDAETVAAVAVTRTQGHCCSPPSTAPMLLHQPSTFSQFPSWRPRQARQGRWERAPCPRLVRAPSLAPVVRGLRAVDNASRRVRRAPTPANPVKLDQEQQVWSRVEEISPPRTPTPPNPRSWTPESSSAPSSRATLSSLDLLESPHLLKRHYSTQYKPTTTRNS